MDMRRLFARGALQLVAYTSATVLAASSLRDLLQPTGSSESHHGAAISSAQARLPGVGSVVLCMCSTATGTARHVRRRPPG